MSKGDDRRPSSKPGLYENNYDRIFAKKKKWHAPSVLEVVKEEASFVAKREETEAERQGREENEMYHMDEANAELLDLEELDRIRDTTH